MGDRIFRLFATPLLGPEDGAMSGGSETPLDGGGAGYPSADGGEFADTDALDATGSDAEGGEGDGREDDVESIVAGDDDFDASLPADERLKRLSKSHNRAKRQLLKLTPWKELQRRGIDPNTALSVIQQYQALQERLQRNPRLLQQIVSGDAADDQGEPQRRGPSGLPPIEDLDPEKLPFNTETDSGKHFVREGQLLRTAVRYMGQLEQRLQQLEGGIRERDQRSSQAAEQSFRKTWVDTAKAAAKAIGDPGIRTIFMDNMTMAMSHPRARELGVKALVNHYLKQLKVAPNTQRIANNAAAARMAQNNGRLPRHMAPGASGHPTPARGGRERLADVHRRVRLGGGAG